MWGEFIPKEATDVPGGVINAGGNLPEGSPLFLKGWARSGCVVSRLGRGRVVSRTGRRLELRYLAVN